MVNEAEKTSTLKIDAAALFKKLGLTSADERPILQGWREANQAWQRERLERIATHAQRVADHLRRFRRFGPDAGARSRSQSGRPRAVWCVELRRHFRTLTEAAAFVGRKPSNISQSLLRGVRCGPYHWEEYDAGRHG